MGNSGMHAAPVREIALPRCPLAPSHPTPILSAEQEDGTAPSARSPHLTLLADSECLMGCSWLLHKQLACEWCMPEQARMNESV